MCKTSNIFEIVNMAILACKICPKITFLGPGPTLDPLYLISLYQVQIQVKLVSTWTYLGKVLLQSIAATLDFSLSSYSPLKMSKKY